MVGDAENWVELMENLQSEVVEAEKAMPTLEDQQIVSRGVEAKLKTRQRLRNSQRKEVEKLIRDVDHTICGPPCEELPMPDCIRALNEEFAAIFPEKIPGGMPPSRPTDHRIDLVQDHKIPGQKLYRLSSADDKELQEQLSSLEKLGFIEPSVSPFGSGVLFVPKPNGKFRLCVDYRPLNAITVADVYPLPRIDKTIVKARGSRWFSKMDLDAGFHQIRVHEAHV